MSYFYNRMTEEEFINELTSDEFAGWTRAQAEALYDAILEFDDGKPVDFDRVVIRCEWSAFNTLQDAFDHWGLDDCKTLDDLQCHTYAVECDDGTILALDI